MRKQTINHKKVVLTTPTTSERERWYKEQTKLSSNFRKRLLEIFKRFVRHKYLLEIGYSWDDHRLCPPEKYETRMEKISWLWVEINYVIKKNLSALPKERYLSIKLEDFGQESIDKVSSFLGLDIKNSIRNRMLKIAQKKPNRTKSRDISSFDKWSDDEKNKFWSITENMMETLNYI